MNYVDEFKEIINRDPKAHLDSAEKVRTFISNSTAIYHGEPIKTLYIPKIFSKEALKALEKAGETTYRILEKVTRHYLEDADYRSLFPYPDGLEELVMTDRIYDMVIPICRLDIFFNEEDFSFKYCEINTDGTSGMVEEKELSNALEYNLAFQEYQKTHPLRTFELYNSFVKVFLEVYRDWEEKKDGLNPAPLQKPYVAIVDFLHDAYISDFYHFRDAFKAAGCECEICEITELKYEDGILYSPEGNRIDAIYRRAVTTDVFSHKEEIQAFLSAVKEKAVCCVGNFCTQVAHNKSLFKILRDQVSLDLLTEEEQQFVLDHFPFTGYLNAKDTGTDLTLQDVIDTKDRWILKPLDLYGAREISVGSDLTPEEWKEKILSLEGTDYIFQEYCHPYKTENFIMENGDVTSSEWINMTGMYMYGGKLAGMFSRLAPNKVIAGHYGGRTIVTLAEI